MSLDRKGLPLVGRSVRVRLNFPLGLRQTTKTLSPTLVWISQKLTEVLGGFSARTVLLDVTEPFALSFVAVSAGKGHSETSPQTLCCNYVY